MMPTRSDPHSATADDAGWSTAVARAAVYSFLSRSLLYPTPESDEATRHELIPILATVSGVSANFERLLESALADLTFDLDTKRRDYAAIFTHIENQDCPVHESAYSPGDVFRRADVMADVAAFYRAHGLHVGGDTRERVDHIATELEFMSFLARKQAYALDHLGPDELDECIRSQAAFVRDHLACWATGFAARLELVATDRFYPAIGAMLAAWIEAEQSALGVVASADRNEPQPLPEPDDGLCGAVPVATPVSIGRARS